MEDGKGGGGAEGRGVLDLPLKYMVTLILAPVERAYMPLPVSH